MKEMTDLSVLHTKLRLWLESCQTEVNGHIAMLEKQWNLGKIQAVLLTLPMK